MGTQSGQSGTLAALGDGIAAAARKAGDIQRAIPLAGGNAEMPPFLYPDEKENHAPNAKAASEEKG